MKFIWRRPLLYLAGVAVLFFGGFYTWQDSDLPQVRASRVESVQGVIVSEVVEKHLSFHQRRLDFVLIAETPAKEKLRVFLKSPHATLRYGDRVKLVGEISTPRGMRNPGGFDYRRYLLGQGIRHILSVGKNDPPKVIEHDQGQAITKLLLSARRNIIQTLNRDFASREAAFLSALFVGEKSGVDDEFTDLFLKTGTIHILAVSGFNIGFLIALMMLATRPLQLSGLWMDAVLLVSVWMYCALVGWQAPILRASIMATTLILSRFAGRRSDILNSLGLAALLIMCINPRQVVDIGFQLSFLTVLGIILFSRSFMSRSIEDFGLGGTGVKGREYLSGLFWTSLIALFVTLPVTVQMFYIFTPLSIVANLIVIPLSLFLFFAGFVYLSLAVWLPLNLVALIVPIKIVMKFFIGSLKWCESLPGSYFVVGKLCWPLWIVLVVGTIYLFSCKRTLSRWPRAASLLLLASSVFLAQDVGRQFQSKLRMTVIDVGQGDSTYFEFPGGGNMLVDAGKGGDADAGRKYIGPFLKSQGVRQIDAVVISHAQEDHIGGMLTVLDDFRVKTVIDSKRDYPSKLYHKVRSRIAEEGAEYLRAGEGDKLPGFDGIAITFLNPPRDAAISKNINNDSLVMRLSYGETDFLMTGDIEEEGMRRVLGSGLDVSSEVLKVPHHGGKIDSLAAEVFYRAVSPSVSVVSVGERNPFGHPRTETLTALQAVPGNKIYRTDQLGAVTLVSDGQSIKVA